MMRAAVPTYDYQCRSCGRITEVIHPMQEPGPDTCEACGGPLRRVLYPTGIIFKGSGFYATDSRAGGARSTKAATDGAPPPSTAPDAGGSAAGPSEPAASD